MGTGLPAQVFFRCIVYFPMNFNFIFFFNSAFLPTGAKRREFKDGQSIILEAAVKSDIDSSTMQDDLNECDNGGLECSSGTNDELAATNSGSQCMGIPIK